MNDKSLAEEYRDQCLATGMPAVAVDRLYLMFASCEDLGKDTGACMMLEVLAPFLTPGSLAIGVALRDKIEAGGRARVETLGAAAAAAEEHAEEQPGQ